MQFHNMAGNGSRTFSDTKRHISTQPACGKGSSSERRSLISNSGEVRSSAVLLNRRDAVSVIMDTSPMPGELPANALPLLWLLRQISFREVNSHRAVRYCGDHLPQHLGAHITRGEHAGEIRAGGFVRHDIAGLVQRQLASEQLRRRGASHADEHARRRQAPAPRRC